VGLALVLVALVLSPVVGVVGLATAVPDARLTFSNVATAPGAPTVGEPVTVTPTVQLSAGSAATVEVERVVLRDGTERLATAAGPGSLSQGDSLTVDLVTSFDRAGRKDLTLVAVGNSSTANETVRIERPLTLVVRDAAPTLDVTVPDPVADVRSQVTVAVSNPNADAVSDVEVTLGGDRAVAKRASIPTLPGGATASVNLSMRPRAGEQPLVVTAGYTTATGHRDATQRRVTVAADPLREDVGVAVSRVPPPEEEAPTGVASLLGSAGALAGAGGGGGALQDEGGEADRSNRARVEVTNFGNTPVEDVVVRPRADDDRLPRGYVGRLAPGESGTVEVDLSTVEGTATVTAVANYTVVGTGPPGSRDGDVTDAAVVRNGSASGSYDYRQPTGDLRVTDVSLSFDDDGTLRITGNAGNVGTAPVSGVVVAVGENEHVAPAYPQRTYFVGTVDGSEFAPFEVTAQVDPDNATEVPVTVTYVVDGEERTRTETLPYDDRLEPPRGGRGGLLSLGTGPLAGLGLLGLLLVGLGAFYVRRR
jgi:hypothetical protein